MLHKDELKYGKKIPKIKRRIVLNILALRYNFLKNHQNIYFMKYVFHLLGDNLNIQAACFP